MDGLEEQAEAGVRVNLEQLYSQETVQIKHSSRESVITRLCEALVNPLKPLVVRKLAFRSGISLDGLRLLRDTLSDLQSSQRNVIQELEFVCLQDTQTLRVAILYCRQCGITRLSLKSYTARILRQSRDTISQSIRFGLMAEVPLPDEQTDHSGENEDHDGIYPQRPVSLAKLEYLEIANYPIGVDGASILEEAVSSLRTLKLVDCDLRSDSATLIAKIIRTSPRLERLDLSYNRHYLGSPITRELTVKTLVEKGLKHNLSLLHLDMKKHDGSHNSHRTMDLSKIDQQLDINRFLRRNFIDQPRRDLVAIPPHLWPVLLARVSAKPSALNMFLRESGASLFAR